MRMISTDYSKSEEMAKDIFKTVDNIVMQVQETQDEFIFCILRDFLRDQTNIVVQKDELFKAISLLRMVEEHGPGIYQCWTTAVEQYAKLSVAYRRGFKDGVKKEHDRIMSILEREVNNES